MQNKPNENAQITEDMLKALYEQEVPFTDQNGNPFKITPDGSLGVLALGHKGIIAWRKKRMQQAEENGQ